MTIKVDTKEPSSIRREVRVEVGSERVAEALEHVLGEISRQARIPGFRPGKVPRALVRKRFARQIDDELLEHLVPHALREALEQTGLRPVHQPVIKDVSLADGQPLAFTAAFEIQPVLDPKDYRGVLVHELSATIGDEQVANALEALRGTAAEYVSVEPRALARGDWALVDLSSAPAGEEGEPHAQSGVLIEVGGEEYHPEFAANLQGMRPGEERSFTITYGDDDPDPSARGRSVTYSVRVKEVKKKVLPDLDDEFARDRGEHQTLDAFKAAIRADLESRLERERRRHHEGQIAAALVPTVTEDVPQALVEHELDRMLEDQARQLVARGIDPRTAPIDWRATRERMREHAVGKVKWELLLDAIARKERIEATDADVSERIARIAEAGGRSVEYVRSKLEKEGRLEGVKAAARLERCVDFLLQNAKMERR